MADKTDGVGTIRTATTVLGAMIEAQAANMTGAEYRNCIKSIDKLEGLADGLRACQLERCNETCEEYDVCPVAPHLSPEDLCPFQRREENDG